MITIYIEENKYGIKDNTKEVVPATHLNAAGAIEEWEYFERSNTNKKQFLSYIRTNEDIDNILSQLKLSI